MYVFSRCLWSYIRIPEHSLATDAMCTVYLDAIVSTLVTSEFASDENPRGIQGEDEECFGDH